jgi:acetyltransferase-like isoleucine patch superfamily enzyme
VIAILGAGPHGKQIAALNPTSYLYDDYLEGYIPCAVGADKYEYLIGAVWPAVRQMIYDKVPGGSTAHQDGRVVFPGVQLGNGAQLGEHVHVLYNAVISHGCEVGDFVTIASGAVLAGEVTVESGAFIGANAVIRHGGITIGRGAVVGMGAVVCDDVPDNTKVVGNPAKVLLT